MDTTVCHTTIGVDHAIAAKVNFASDPQALVKIDTLLYPDKHWRKLLFKKVLDLKVENNKLTLYYSSAESIPSVKRHVEKLIAACAEAKV